MLPEHDKPFYQTNNLTRRVAIHAFILSIVDKSGIRAGLKAKGLIIEVPAHAVSAVIVRNASLADCLARLANIQGIWIISLRATIQTL